MKGRRCGVVRFAWFIQDYAVCFLHGLRMISVDEGRSKQREEESLIGLVDSLPDGVRDAAGARG